MLIAADPTCLFCKIIRGEASSRRVYEDEDVFAFHDIHPVAAVHFMIVPKLHIASLADCDSTHQRLLGKLLGMAAPLAREQGLADGFRTVVNTGRIGHQEVYHLHIHIIGGASPLGPILGTTAGSGVARA